MPLDVEVVSPTHMVLQEQVDDQELDLSADAKNPESPRVVEVLQPEDYGIEVMDYIL